MAVPYSPKGVWRATDFTDYIRRIRRSRLTREIERYLVPAARDGDPEARSELIRHVLGLLCQRAARFGYLYRLPDYNDLVQEGAIAVLDALDHYNPEKGASFATFCIYFIQKRMWRFAAWEKWCGILSPHLAESFCTIRLAAERMADQLGREPTIEEIAERTKTPCERVERCLAMRLPLSLNFPERADCDSDDLDGSATYEDDPWYDYERAESLDPRIHAEHDLQIHWVRKAVSELPDEERAIVVLRYGLSGEKPLSWQKIARRLRRDENKIKSIHNRAIEKLKRKLAEG